MELELTQPLLTNLTKNVSLSNLVTKLSTNKSDFEGLHQYFKHSEVNPMALKGHTEYLIFAIISPDNKFIASGGGEPNLRIWGLQDRTEVKVFKGHDVTIKCAEFTQDSKFLASGDIEGNLFLWNLEEMKLEVQLEKYKCGIQTMKTTKDGQYLITGARDGVIKVWDLEERSVKFELKGHENIVICLDISSDQKYLVSGSDDYTVRIWDLQERKQLKEYSHSHHVASVVISENGKYVASGSYDHTVKVWNLVKGKLEAVFEGHSGTVYSIVMTIDGKYIISGSEDSTIRIWNLKTKKEENVFKGHSNAVNRLAIASNGKFLISGSKDSTVRLWNLSEMKFESELIGHSWEVISLSITSDDKCLVSASWDKTVRIWDLQTTKEKAILEGHTDRAYSLTATGDSRFLASGSIDGTFRLWSLETMTEVYKESRGYAYTAITSDCKYIAVALKDYRVCLVDLQTKNEETGDNLGITLGQHTERLLCLSISRDDKYLVSGSNDSTIKIFNLETLEEEPTLTGQSSYIWCLSFSHDSKYLASGSEDNTVIIWNFRERREEIVIEGQFDPIYCCVFTSDTKYLVYGCRDSKIRIWNLNDRKLEVVLEGHKSAVNCLAITSDDKYLVSGGNDSTRIWNLREMSQEKLLAAHHDISTYAVTITKDMKHLATCSEDSKVRVWDLSSCIAEYSLVDNNTYEIKGFEYSFETEDYANMIKREKKTKHKNNMNKMLVMPNKINPLHLYAYYNDTNLMTEALKSGCYFVNTKFGESPITICLRRNSRKCLDILLEYIINLGKTNISKQSYILETITNEIPEIIKTGSKYLMQFCDILVKTSEPSFIIPRKSLPMRAYKNDCIVDPSFFVSGYKEEGSEQLAEIVTTRFKRNIQRGSIQSIELLESIYESPNEEIYRSTLVRTLIDYKWDDLYNINLTLTLLYMFNLGLLIALVFLNHDQDLAILISRIGFIGINCFFLLYELYQGATTGPSYFYDFWNYLDITRSPMCITWVFLSITESSGNFYDFLTFLINLMCWVRGLTYFRTFKKTRIFVRMVLEVTKDTSSFLIILFYTTCAYCTLFAASSNAEGNHDFIKALKDAYELDLGNFESKEFTSSQWIVFIIASIINCIIMLNLLISILGDSYGKIQVVLIESDYSQMLDVIIELEKLMILNKHKGSQVYLQVCKEIEEDEDVGEVENQVKILHEKIANIYEQIEMKFQENQTSIQESFKRIEESHKSIKEDLKELKNKEIIREINE